MSSTGQVTSSPPNFQLIVNALADYANLTGIDLTKNAFAEKIERSDSPEAILELLQEREKSFKEYREGNRRLINCLSPGVKVLHAFSGVAGEAFSLVSVTYQPVNLLTHSVRSRSHQQRLSSPGSMSSSLYVPSTRSSIGRIWRKTMPGCQWGYIELWRCSWPFWMFGKFPQASWDLFDDPSHYDDDGCHNQNYGGITLSACPGDKADPAGAIQ
jgi:hypothetical protein